MVSIKRVNSANSLEELDEQAKLKFSPKQGAYYHYTYFPVKLSILTSPQKLIYWSIYGTFGMAENFSIFFISIILNIMKWVFIIALYFTLLLTPLIVVFIMWLTCLNNILL